MGTASIVDVRFRNASSLDAQGVIHNPRWIFLSLFQGAVHLPRRLRGRGGGLTRRDHERGVGLGDAISVVFQTHCLKPFENLRNSPAP